MRRTSISCGRSVGDYSGPLRQILHALKYDGRISLSRDLGLLMQTHGRAVLTGADLVVPVPLHWLRQWRRSFNQAAELARGLGLPVAHALRRRRHTRSQTDLPAVERQKNVRDAFVIRRGRQGRCVEGACVVLVDDVSTTGATLEACASVLIRAGAREVRTLTAARVVTRVPGEPPSARLPSNDHPVREASSTVPPARGSSS